MTKTEAIGIKPKNNRILMKENQNRIGKDSNWIIVLTILHLPLGLLLFAFGSLGIIHPLGIFTFGIYCALSQKYKLNYIAYIVAYLIGCEVLWRMADTPVFWEFGKYGSSFIMIIALFRRGHYYPPLLPTIFLFTLLPACIITFLTNDVSTAREQISFNLSGPFFLFVSCYFFSFVKVNRIHLKILFSVLFISLLSVATTTLFYTVANMDDITFSTESNVATSGGFGPNQVSSMLGLGAFIGLASYFLFCDNLKSKLYFIIGSVFLAAQSVLTFSRGGMYNAIGAITVLIFLQFQNITEGIKRTFPFILVIGIFLLLIFPFLDNFTGGKLKERFEETETTGRYEIIESDFQILSENPIFGVGLGNAKVYREKFLGRQYLSHTEFSRLVSEHGFFGILAVLILVFILISSLIKQKSVLSRAFIAGSVLWCCLFMVNAGMRLAAPSFLWGLSFVTIIEPHYIRRNKTILRNLRKSKK